MHTTVAEQTADVGVPRGTCLSQGGVRTLFCVIKQNSSCSKPILMSACCSRAALILPNCTPAAFQEADPPPPHHQLLLMGACNRHCTGIKLDVAVRRMLRRACAAARCMYSFCVGNTALRVMICGWPPTAAQWVAQGVAQVEVEGWISCKGMEDTLQQKHCCAPHRTPVTCI